MVRPSAATVALIFISVKVSGLASISGESIALFQSNMRAQAADALERLTSDGEFTSLGQFDETGETLITDEQNDENNTAGWSNTRVQEYGNGWVHGRFGQVSGIDESCAKTFDLPWHTGITIQVRFWILDTWDDQGLAIDTIDLKVDGNTIFTARKYGPVAQTWTTVPGNFTTPSTNGAAQSLYQERTFQVDHNGSGPLEVIFAGNTDYDIDDESWAFDRFKMTVTTAEPPTPAPTPVAVTAKDDPHCANLRGEAFDVFTVGEVQMVAMPRMGKLRGQDLRVVAEVVPVSQARCAATLIQKVRISGALLGQAPPLNISAGSQGVTLSPTWKPTFDGKTNLKVRDQAAKLTLKGAGITIAVRHRTGKRTGAKYLNLEVKGLKPYGEKTVGGLLGFDSHSTEMMPPPGCEAQQHEISLFETDAEGTEGTEARLLSMAKAS